MLLNCVTDGSLVWQSFFSFPFILLTYLSSWFEEHYLQILSSSPIYLIMPWKNFNCKWTILDKMISNFWLLLLYVYGCCLKFMLCWAVRHPFYLSWRKAWVLPWFFCISLISLFYRCLQLSCSYVMFKYWRILNGLR